MAEQYDLQTEFTEANNKYFSGKLRPVPLKWHGSGRNLGYVRASVTKLNSYQFIVDTIKQLSMNKTINWSREDFLRTFLHELCHLYMLQNYTEFNWFGGYHGHAWQTLAASVGEKAGVSNVDQEKHEGAPLMRKDEYVKERYIILFDKAGIAYGLVDNTLIGHIESDISSIERQLLFHGVSIDEVELYKTRLPVFTSIPVKRKSIRKFNFKDHTVNQQTAKDLRAGKDNSKRII